MQLGLETDANNTNFSGAHDPDAALFVRFFDKEETNAFQTELQKRPIKFMQTMIHIEKPGDVLSVIERISTSADQKRFPKHWAHYLNTKNGAVATMAGTMLSDWQMLTPAQAGELRHYQFYTVEQVANASDAQINAIGMIAGMAPFAFRDKARLFLKVASDNALASKQEGELKAAKEREDAQAKTIAEMQGQLAALMAAQANPVEAARKADQAALTKPASAAKKAATEESL